MSGRTDMAGENRRDPGDAQTSDGIDWLGMARDAYRQGRDYFDTSVRKRVEEALSHNASRHAPGSKYYSDLYKRRSKGFRPKTKAMTLRREAQLANALFATDDLLTIKATIDSPEATLAASINQALLQYRLSNTIPWYLTAIGAYQDATVTGICISHQFWDYRESVEKIAERDEEGNPVIDEDGEPVEIELPTVISDTPMVELRPVENILFHPGADWRDPINTSPYLIDRIPMTLGDVRLMIESEREDSLIRWLDVSDSQLLQASSSDEDDTVRRQRNGNREDPDDLSYSTDDFRTVWVHRNIIRRNGVDMVFYTAKDITLLSEPIPLRLEYPWLKPGERPYVAGYASVETHTNYPASPVSHLSPLQKEANELNNQRRDNVALAMNRRWIVRSGASVDKASLSRNVPGGVTEVTDINKDIRADAPPDVTGSSYQEQDRLNMDFDELAGTFSPGTVGSARNLNETVGGMDLMKGEADATTEYPLKTFVETWVEPVLRQLVRLEQRHESDETVLRIAGEQAKAQVGQITDATLQGSMEVSVNVGFGATDPKRRVEKLVFGLSTILQIRPELQQRIDDEEIAKEIFGALGYKDGSRFLLPEDQMQPQEPPPDPAIEKLNLEREINEQRLQLQEAIEAAKLEDAELDRRAMLEKAYIEQENLIYKLMQEDKITQQRFEAEMRKIETNRQNKVDEMKLKLKFGTGI